jgi:hypothetical protein
MISALFQYLSRQQISSLFIEYGFQINDRRAMQGIQVIDSQSIAPCDFKNSNPM